MYINNGVVSDVELQAPMFMLLHRFHQLVAIMVGICSSQSSDVLCLPRSPDIDILVLFQSSVYGLRQLNYYGKLIIVNLWLIIV